VKRSRRARNADPSDPDFPDEEEAEAPSEPPSPEGRLRRWSDRSPPTIGKGTCCGCGRASTCGIGCRSVVRRRWTVRREWDASRQPAGREADWQHTAPVGPTAEERPFPDAKCMEKTITATSPKVWLVGGAGGSRPTDCPDGGAADAPGLERRPATRGDRLCSARGTLAGREDRPKRSREARSPRRTRPRTGGPASPRGAPGGGQGLDAFRERPGRSGRGRIRAQRTRPDRPPNPGQGAAIGMFRPSGFQSSPAARFRGSKPTGHTAPPSGGRSRR